MSRSQPDEDGDGEEEPATMDGIMTASRGPNKNDMAADYMPHADHWAAKTRLDPHDPAAIGGLSEIGTMFPEVDDLQPVIDNVLEEFLPAKTSVGGRSRDEYGDILMSMFGGQGTVDEAKAWKAALGADGDDD